MSIAPLKNMVVRLPVVLEQAIRLAAEAQGCTISEWVRAIIQSHLDLDPATGRHAETVFEITKTRALFMRWLDTQLEKGEVDELIRKAEGDAREHVQERSTTANKNLTSATK